MAISNSVREARLQAGLTIAGLARRANISRQTATWIDQNHGHNATADTMVRIARALNKEVGDLFFEAAEQQSEQVA